MLHALWPRARPAIRPTTAAVADGPVVFVIQYTHKYAVAFVESRGAGKILWESETRATAPYAAVSRVERAGQLRLRFQKEKAEKGPRSRRVGRYWTLGRDPTRGDGLSRRRFLYTRFAPSPTLRPPLSARTPTNLRDLLAPSRAPNTN